MPLTAEMGHKRTEAAKNQEEIKAPSVVSFRLFAAMPNCEQRP